MALKRGNDMNESLDKVRKEMSTFNADSEDLINEISATLEELLSGTEVEDSFDMVTPDSSQLD